MAVMYERVVDAAVLAFYAYTAIGLMFALAFAARGAARIDAQVHGSSLWFRVLIIPGALALWPLLLRAWLRARSISDTAGGQ